MHHKRRSRRRDKRTMLSCGCCEDIRSGKGLPRIDENEVCNGRASKPKARKPKEKCPVNGKHEWYREDEVAIKTIKTFLPGTYKCDECIELRRRYRAETGFWFITAGCDEHTYKYDVEITTRTKICIHCDADKSSESKRTLDPNINHWGMYRPRSIKKRPVQY